MVNHLHKIVQLVLALAFVLACHHLHVGLPVIDICFRAKRLLKSIDFESQGNQVFLLTIKHMVTNTLRQCLEDIRLMMQLQLQHAVILVCLATTRVLRYRGQFLLSSFHV